MHQQLVATYIIENAEVQVIQCSPNGTADEDVFYDLYHAGQCINLGEPWYDDGQGIPTKEEICEVFFS